MTYLMFSAGIFVGFVLGVVLWEIIISGPQHRRRDQREWRLEDRAAMWRNLWFDAYADQLDDHDIHSRKAANMRLVK